MNKSEKFFDKVSSRSKREPNKTALKVIEACKPFLEKGYYLLDLGCGSGAITNKIAKEVKTIDAIDISSGMLDFAKQQADEQAIENVNYSKASIFDERFGDKTFDVVVAFNVLHYIDDMPKVIQRIGKILKPNGIFISSTACLKEKRSLINYIVLVLTKLGVMPATKFYRKIELENYIKNENFEIVKSEKVSKLPEYFIVANNKSKEKY